MPNKRRESDTWWEKGTCLLIFLELPRQLSINHWVWMFKNEINRVLCCRVCCSGCFQRCRFHWLQGCALHLLRSTECAPASLLSSQEKLGASKVAHDATKNVDCVTSESRGGCFGALVHQRTRDTARYKFIIRHVADPRTFILGPPKSLVFERPPSKSSRRSSPNDGSLKPLVLRQRQIHSSVQGIIF